MTTKKSGRTRRDPETSPYTHSNAKVSRKPTLGENLMRVNRTGPKIDASRPSHYELPELEGDTHLGTGCYRRANGITDPNDA